MGLAAAPQRPPRRGPLASGHVGRVGDDLSEHVAAKHHGAPHSIALADTDPVHRRARPTGHHLEPDNLHGPQLVEEPSQRLLGWIRTQPSPLQRGVAMASSRSTAHSLAPDPYPGAEPPPCPVHARRQGTGIADSTATPQPAAMQIGAGLAAVVGLGPFGPFVVVVKGPSADRQSCTR